MKRLPALLAVAVAVAIPASAALTLPAAGAATNSTTRHCKSYEFKPLQETLTHITIKRGSCSFSHRLIRTYMQAKTNSMSAHGTTRGHCFGPASYADCTVGYLGRRYRCHHNGPTDKHAGLTTCTRGHLLLRFHQPG